MSKLKLREQFFLKMMIDFGLKRRLRHLKDGLPGKREKAAKALSKYDGKKVIVHLLNAFYFDIPSVSRCAKESLCKIELSVMDKTEGYFKFISDHYKGIFNSENKTEEIIMDLNSIGGNSAKTRTIIEEGYIKLLSSSTYAIFVIAAIGLEKLNISNPKISKFIDEKFKLSLKNGTVYEQINAAETLVYRGYLQGVTHLKELLNTLPPKHEVVVSASWDHSYVGAGGASHWIEDSEWQSNPEFEAVKVALERISKKLEEKKTETVR